jgi:hypothetical protein
MARPTVPDDRHEWLSFEDPDEARTWVFDVTFLTSNWACIFGRGCRGVLTEPTPELQQGCCSYGAHFTGDDDRARVEARVSGLDDSVWQFRRVASRRGGPIHVNRTGETVTRLVDGACIFLNRPGFPGGAGCALHRAALERGERPLDWKPEVCWQLPLRRSDESDVYGYVTSTVREWKRRDWGDGGFEFHWWCTADPKAFVESRPVYETLREELVEMVGQKPYDILVDQLQRRQRSGRWTPLPHPGLKRRR